jgi:hypothetical protein
VSFARRPSKTGRCRWCDRTRLKVNGGTYCPHCDVPMDAEERDTCADCRTMFQRSDSDAPPSGLQWPEDPPTMERV